MATAKPRSVDEIVADIVSCADSMDGAKVDARRYAKELVKAASGGSWKPIKTCPGKITRALIYWPAFKLGDYLMQTDEPTGDGLIAEGLRIGGNEWECDLVVEHYEDEAGFGYGDPTHWMPMPDPPTKKAAK